MEYRNNYKRRYYNHKIFGIYLTGISLLLGIVGLNALFFGSTDWNLEGSGHALWTLFCVALVFCVFVMANRARWNRFHDDIVGDRIIDSSNDFWTGVRIGSIFATLLWEIGLFFWARYTAIADDDLEVSVVIIVFLMIAVLIFKIWYHKQLRFFEDNEFAIRKFEKEERVNWKKQKAIEIFFAIIVGLMIIAFFVMLRSFNGGRSEEESFIFLLLLAITVTVCIVRVRKLENWSDEEELPEWLEKRKQADAENEPETAEIIPSETVVAEEEEHDEDIVVEPVAIETVTLSDGREVHFGEFTSFAAVSADLCAYAKENGVNLDEASCGEIVAAFAASRAVWVRCEDEEFSGLVAKIVCAYFTGSAAVAQVGTVTTAQELLGCTVYKNSYTASTLVGALVHARQSTNTLNTLVFSGAETEYYDTVFRPLIKNFRAPEGENRVRIEAENSFGYESAIVDSHITFPSNLWCVFVGKADGRISKEIGQYASEVRIKSMPHETPLVFAERESVLSYARYNELLNESLAESFLSLDIWKKFDRIEEYLQGQIPFEISNPLARQIEQYSSVLLTCGKSAEEIVDSVIVSRILPMLDGYEKSQIDQEGNSFAELLDGLFGMDNLPLTHKALNDRNFN